MIYPQPNSIESHATLTSCLRLAKPAARAIVAAGGKQRTPVREYFPGGKPYRMVYMEDPLGKILEIYSHSYELTYGAGAYQ